MPHVSAPLSLKLYVMRKFTLILAFFVSACSSIEDVSNKDFVNINMGSVSSTKPLFVCVNKLDSELTNQLFINWGFEKCQSGEHVISIPENSPLKITKVVKHTHTALFTRERWLAVGNFENTEFYYYLDWVTQTDGTFFKQTSNVPWR